MKVVIDTNVWVSALVFGGKPVEVFMLQLHPGSMVIVSEQLITEVKNILSKKFPTFLINLDKLLSRLESHLQYVELKSLKIDIVRDPKDNMILETAIIGGADYIISGDDDLLSLQKYKSVKIISPAEFLQTRVK